MTDPYEQDIDSFHAFLQSIHSINEFYERKKPAFRDWYAREMVNETVKRGLSTAENMLLGLKQHEKQRYVRLRDGTAKPEDHWPISYFR